MLNLSSQYDHGALIGPQCNMVVDQGVGFDIFNRLTAVVKRIYPLPRMRLIGWTPATMALSVRMGNALGKLGAYDYYVLGGHSNYRGYGLGEIGFSRRFAQASAEISCALPRSRVAVFSFYDYIDSIRSSYELFRQSHILNYSQGAGLSWGMGTKLFAFHFEYSRNCNKGTGSWYVRYCDRS